MNATLETQILSLSKRQKLALAERLLADAGLQEKPPGLLSASDPKLETILRQRLSDKRPGTWLSPAEFRAKTGLR